MAQATKYMSYRRQLLEALHKLLYLQPTRKVYRISRADYEIFRVHPRFAERLEIREIFSEQLGKFEEVILLRSVGVPR